MLIIDDFPAHNNNGASFKVKTKIQGRIEEEDDDTKNVKIRVPLKNIRLFRRTLEMPLINCETSLILTWSNICFIIDNPVDGQEATFTITDTELYVPVVTLFKVYAKLLEQIKSGFKRTINWNKYEPKVTVEQPNQYLDFLINPCFQGVNRRFVLSSEDIDGRISYERYCLPLLEIKEYKVVINGRNIFDQSVKNNLITYDKIQKISTREGDNCKTGSLLDYNYLNSYHKMIVIDLSKQQALDADPKAMQQIHFTANLDQEGSTTLFFIIEEAKETILPFSQGKSKIVFKMFILF